MMEFNKIEFKPINSFFHTYYIPGLHDYLLTFKQFAIDSFFENRQERFKSGQYNSIIPPGELKNTLALLNEKILHKYYDIKGPTIEGGIGISYQDNKRFNSQFHMHRDSSIVSTTYIDPPEKESFEIWEPPAHPLKIKVLKDTIHFMPNWLLHRATPQEVKTPRICFNWTYIFQNRPTHKLTKDRW